MAENLTPELIRRGWALETTSHRDNLRRALESAARHLAAAQEALGEKDEADTYALRQLAADAAEAYQRGAALDALRRVEFALPDDTTKEN